MFHPLCMRKFRFILYSTSLDLNTKGSRTALASQTLRTLDLSTIFSLTRRRISLHSFLSSLCPKDVSSSVSISGAQNPHGGCVVVNGGQEEYRVPNIIGVGLSPSLGMRKGHVIDVEELIHNIISSLEDAERMAGVPVNHVFVGMSGSHIEAFDSRGVIAISGAEITTDDVGRVLEAAQAVPIPCEPPYPPYRTQVLRRRRTARIKKSRRHDGHPARGGGAHHHGPYPAREESEKCIDQAGVDIDALVPRNRSPRRRQPSRSARRNWESSSWTLARVAPASPSSKRGRSLHSRHAASSEARASRMTSRSASRTSVDTAEKIKIEFGSVLPAEMSEREMIDLSSVSKVDTQTVSKKYMAEIMQARYYEIFTLVKK